MTRLFAAAAAATSASAALTAVPALAHDGAHLHPHGSDATLLGLLAALVAVGAVGWTLRR